MPVYEPPGPIARAFMKSNARRRIITGPFGSGKSVACCMDIVKRMRQQAPNSDGWRKTRWGIIRNTYPDLKNTTARTWKDWVTEEQFGEFVNVAPFEHRVRYQIGDGSKVEADVIFLALNKDEDAKKFLSLEVTGLYFNEVRELRRSVVEAGDGRIGRYPAMKDGGPTWHGLIADTNMPDEDHWLYELAENNVAGWEFHHQPGGVIKVDGKWVHNPMAENLPNLTPGYYTNQLAGKSEDWVKVHLGAKYGTLPVEGAFYAELISELDAAGHICAVPHQKERTVETWWDLGHSDDTSIWFIQVIRGEIHVIDYYENYGKDIAHYAEVVNGKKGYNYHLHHLPHDAKAETLAAGGRSIAEQMAEHFGGPSKLAVHGERNPLDRIQATRAVLPRCYFDKEKTKPGVRSLRSYRRERDEKRSTFKRTPLHDWASHASDAFGMFAYNYIEDTPALSRPPLFRNPTFNEVIASTPVYEERI